MQEIDKLNGLFNTIYPQEIIYNALQAFGDRLAVLTRFTPADTVILHMLAVMAAPVPVLVVDHDALNSPAHTDILYRLAPKLIRIGGDAGQTLNRKLTSYDAWLVGQIPTSYHPAAVPVLAYTKLSGRARIAPLAYWTNETVNAYLREHQLPVCDEPPTETRGPKTVNFRG